GDYYLGLVVRREAEEDWGRGKEHGDEDANAFHLPRHAPLQVNRGLHGFDALASRSDGLIERGLKPLIGFDQLRVLIRRGNRRLSYQLVPLPGAEVVMTAHRPYEGAGSLGCCIC